MVYSEVTRTDVLIKVGGTEYFTPSTLPPDVLEKLVVNLLNTIASIEMMEGLRRVNREQLESLKEKTREAEEDAQSQATLAKEDEEVG